MSDAEETSAAPADKVAAALARALARSLKDALESGRRARPLTHDALTRLFRPEAIASQYEALYQRVARGR